MNLIVDQNASMAKAVGDYERMYSSVNKKLFPYVIYHASVGSRKPRSEHQRYDGMIFEKDDPWLKTHWPPWDFNCHCRLENCTDKKAHKTPDLIQPPTPADKVTVDTKSGYSFDPAHAFEKFDYSAIKDPDLQDKAKTGVEKILEKAEPETKTQETFIPAKTTKEATEYTRQYLGNNVNWDKMPLETVNAINQELTQLKSEYHILEDKYVVIGRNGKWKGSEAAHAGAKTIEFNPQYATLEDWKKVLNDYEEERRKCTEQIIELNKKDKLTKEETKFRDKLAEHLKYSRYNVLISPEQAMRATVTHESGHTIMYRKIYGEQDAAGYTIKRHWRTGAELKIPNLKQEDTDTYKLVQDTFNQAVNNKDIYKISEYAKKDCWEFFSESFVMYRLEKQKLPDYIVTMIEKVAL